MAKANKEQVLKRLKTAIIVLSIIFVLSFMVLAARIIYVSFYADRGTTVIVPDNIVEAQEASADTTSRTASSSFILLDSTEKVKNADPLAGILCEKPTEPQIMLLSARTAQATVVELYLGQDADNDAFNAQNMFPGDTVTKYYCLKVYHKADVAVYFDVTDIEETKSLGDVLNIKVTKFNEDGSSEQVVYNGSFANAKGNAYSTTYPASFAQQTIAYYKIEVSLPTSAGNEYQGASLSANFNWYAENPDPHTCESKCPTCNKCLDATCTESVCADKCPGHTVVPPVHVCESKCSTCNKCLDATCTESVCADKCPGHTVVPPAHTCESKCPTCNKCLDDTCTESVCEDKCPGHGGAAGTHECESKCEVCGGCKDKECTNGVCSEKCDCSPLISAPTKKYLIWPYTIVPTLSGASLIPLIIIYKKKQKEDDDEQQ